MTVLYNNILKVTLYVMWTCRSLYTFVKLNHLFLLASSIATTCILQIKQFSAFLGIIFLTLCKVDHIIWFFYTFHISWQSSLRSFTRIHAVFMLVIPGFKWSSCKANMFLINHYFPLRLLKDIPPYMGVFIIYFTILGWCTVCA